jgi:Ca2+/Na+ antiporter
VHARIPLLAGCSGTSLVAGGEEIEDGAGLVLGLYSLPGANLTALHFTQEQVERAGDPARWHSESAVPPDQTNGWLCFADPFHLDCESWLRGWNEAYSPRPILGGLASGDASGQGTQVYLNGDVFEEGGVAISAAAMAERKAETRALEVRRQPLWLTAAILAASIGALIGGSHVLVEGAVTVARSLGVGEAVIGATIVAFGTVMPELVASITAALNRHTDLALGNVIGSIVVNVLGVLGLAAAVQPFPIPPEMLRFDLWVMLAACVLLVALGRRAGGIGRGIAGGMIAAYVAYDIALYAGVPELLRF